MREEGRREDGRESREERRKRFLERSRRLMNEAYSSSDYPIIQAINAYKELEKIRGIIYERLEEWYGMYFQDVKLTNYDSYSDFILRIKKREDATEELLKEIVGNDAKNLLKSVQYSRAPLKLGENEYETIKQIADAEKRLSEAGKSIDDYLKESVKKAMPNVSHLIEYKIAAELLSKAGSLERLATMPASTVQLLGAEKALFKHIKFGSKPPKYGILFKLPQLSSASKKQKGRMARAFATKISIAARADAFSKRFIADKLKQDLDKALANIKKD